jgi:hypothetical protein
MSSDDKDRGTTAANQRGPTAEPFEVGLSSNVERDSAAKMTPSLHKRLMEHKARKAS